MWSCRSLSVLEIEVTIGVVLEGRVADWVYSLRLLAVYWVVGAVVDNGHPIARARRTRR